MKQFEKMTKTEFVVFFLLAIASGLMIGIGATASLLANTLFGGGTGKLVGATLFSLGIYAIVTFDLRLFTGMVADLPKMGVKNTWKLPFCFIGNILGVALIALLVYYSPVKDSVVPPAQALIGNKINAENWPIRAFCSSILCGALITVSVWSVKYAPRKGLNSSIGVMFPIIVFAFCGFDHSVANMMYFYYLGEFSRRVVGYIVLSMIGNIIGGVILPLISLLREHVRTK